MTDFGYEYQTLEQCCDAWYGWDIDACLNVGGGGDTPNPEFWYVNWQKYYCVQNCPVADGGNCGGLARFWEILHPDLDTCCKRMLGHQDSELCRRDSLHRDHEHYTGKFYVNHRDMRCARDCEMGSSPDCQGSPYDITVTLFDSPDACCALELPWIDTNDCINETTMGGHTQQWFRDSLDGSIAPFRLPSDSPDD